MGDLSAFFMPLIQAPELKELIRSVVSEELSKSAKVPEVNDDDLVDIDEARVILGAKGRPVSKAFIYRESHFGRIPKLKFGNRLRFRRKDLLKMRELYTAEPLYKDEVIYQQIKSSADKKLKK